ncbi:Pectinesterase inhibitor [Corchorus olitorius]|uniref:Pectinesterase inhibitor n=1 Tax=Corchorus olitorius TaxID=93759 RepID=A0A1R3HF22_9ROSI|nr:Pectinesterase inhibitor [Corchorus olitorius]
MATQFPLLTITMILIPLLVLNQCLTSIGQETGKALIATVCSKTENPQDCISLLESDPRSFTSNLTGLARIALEITASKANTSLVVAEYWLQHAKDYTDWASASACRGGYASSVNSMQDSLRAFDELKSDRLFQNLQYVINNVTYCQKTRYWISPSPPASDAFNDLNATMLKITKYVLAILHQLF